ncbi:MAG TPA: NAD(P)-dependent oxidoreductase [Kineosporiaceae bacterium]|nr:NAD(P)-dependent oxidoreductase [Kineosporiaceae bacterium]
MQRTTSRIGVVGLGAMGGRITSRLLSLGHEVYGTNRTRTKADALIAQGLIWCDSPRETAQSADVVISMVTDSTALEAVTAGPDGILAGLRAGMIYLDMSTVSPQTSRALAHRVACRGAAMLAAPVSGSLPAAERGSLAVIAGGDPDAFARVEPILRQLGRTVTFVGDNGHALLLKLAINISLGVQMLAFSEGLLLAERGGVQRQVALDVLTSSAIGSPMLAARAPLLLELPDQAWFDVAQMQKDIRLALDSARDLKVPLPSTSVADDVLSAARMRGYEHRDIAVVVRVLSEMAATTDGWELESATT